MPLSTNPASYWTQVALEANRADFSAPPTARPPEENGGPTRSSRALAIVHLAMHDAYFSILGTTATWLPNLNAPAEAQDPEAAMAGAADAALRALYHAPAQTAAFDQAYAGFRANHPMPPESEAWGRRVAARIVSDRADDDLFAAGGRTDSSAPYHHRTDPYNPGQKAHGLLWGNCRPFVVPRIALQPPPGWRPDGFDSNPWYDTEWRQVCDLGARVKHGRSPDQTVAGIFWAYDGAESIGTPPRLYAQVCLQILDTAAAAQPGVVETQDYVRLLTLIATAMADAGIQAWHWKYVYDLWRPVVGIRESDGSFGPAASTSGKATNTLIEWEPLGAPRTNRGSRLTPPFPAYPSGHATFGSAAFHTIRYYMQQRGLATVSPDEQADTIAFDFVSDELNGKNIDPDGGTRPNHLRKFDSLWEATVENALSRVFLGVHWQFDGLSRTDGAGGAQHGVPATPADLGPVGGVWLGREIARRLHAGGLVHQT
jgi:vanadium chloroperoxidase